MALAGLRIESVMRTEHVPILIAAVSITFVLLSVFSVWLLRPKFVRSFVRILDSYGTFFYVSFLKPHTGDASEGQQGALESFYKAQVVIHPLKHSLVLTLPGRPMFTT